MALRRVSTCALALLSAIAVSTACSGAERGETSFEQPATPTSVADSDAEVHGDARRLADDFIAFARSPAQAPVPRFASHLTFVLGPERSAELVIEDPTDPESWIVDLSPTLFRASSAPKSPLTDIAEAENVTLSLGPRLHSCAAAAPTLDGKLANFDYVSIQPTEADSCLSWFAVDLLINDNGEIAFVLLDLYEP